MSRENCILFFLQICYHHVQLPLSLELILRMRTNRFRKKRPFHVLLSWSSFPLSTRIITGVTNFFCHIWKIIFFQSGSISDLFFSFIIFSICHCFRFLRIDTAYCTVLENFNKKLSSKWKCSTGRIEHYRSKMIVLTQVPLDHFKSEQHLEANVVLTWK